MGGVDQQARDLAREAISLQSAHERVCAERWAACEKSFLAGSEKMKGLADGQRQILRVLGWGAALIVTTLLGSAGWMVSRLADLALK